jgi:hypothetical protein
LAHPVELRLRLLAVDHVVVCACQEPVCDLRQALTGADPAARL